MKLKENRTFFKGAMSLSLSVILTKILGVAFKVPLSYILTDEGMFEVSSKGNVIVIVLDRFDVYYYGELVKTDADFFTPLDGFT